MTATFAEVTSKAQKLMALRDRAGTPAEAIAAAEMLNKLLIKHHIDEQDLTPEEKSKVVAKTLDLGGRNMLLENRRNLMSAICRMNFSKVVYYSGSSGDRCEVVGHDASVEIIEQTYSYLFITLVQMAKDEWKKFKKEDRLEAEYTGRWNFEKSFHKGAVIELNARIRELLNTNNADVTTSALVVVLGTEVKEFYDSRYSDLRSVNARGASYSSGEGYSRGRKAGRNIDLGGSKRLKG